VSELLQFIIVVAFGAFCFGCGVFTAFIVTRNKYRDEMIKRGVARYNSRTDKWEWREPPKEPRTWKVESGATECGEYRQAAGTSNKSGLKARFDQNQCAGIH
jgi:hypothetical protein